MQMLQDLGNGWFWLIARWLLAIWAVQAAARHFLVVPTLHAMRRADGVELRLTRRLLGFLALPSICVRGVRDLRVQPVGEYEDANALGTIWLVRGDGTECALDHASPLRLKTFDALHAQFQAVLAGKVWVLVFPLFDKTIAVLAAILGATFCGLALQTSVAIVRKLLG